MAPCRNPHADSLPKTACRYLHQGPSTAKHIKYSKQSFTERGPPNNPAHCCPSIWSSNAARVPKLGLNILFESLFLTGDSPWLAHFKVCPIQTAESHTDKSRTLCSQNSPDVGWERHTSKYGTAVLRTTAARQVLLDRATPVD
jgi:hypothetical protein